MANLVEKSRSDPDMRGPADSGGREDPENVWKVRRGVMHDQGCASGECGNLPVPHHPTRGGVEHHPITGPAVRVQSDFGEVLEQNASGSVNQALGLARGAGREEHVSGVVEWQAHVLGFCALLGMHRVAQA